MASNQLNLNGKLAIPKEIWIIEEDFLCGGWTAIEGTITDSGAEELGYYTSLKEAEEEIRSMVKEFTEEGLEGYTFDSFEAAQLTPFTKLREDIKLDKVCLAYLKEKFPEEMKKK